MATFKVNARLVEDEDLRRIHRATTMPDLWGAICAVLGRRITHHSVSLYFNYLEPDRRFHVLHTQAAPGRLVAWNIRRALSPAPAFLREHRGIKSYGLRELYPDARSFLRSDYFRDVMRVEGWQSLLGLGFWEQDELGALLVLRRTPEQGEFSSFDSAWLEALHPHVHDTLQRVRSSAAESVLRSGLAGCLEVLDLGVMFFDERARLRFHNEAAARLCIDWLHGPGAGTQLDSAAAFAVPAPLAAAIRRVALSTGAETGVEDLPREIRATLQRIELRTGERVSAGVIVQLSRVAVSKELPLTHRLPLLKLTPREREVAELAAQGLSNGEIASRLHKSERTVAAQISSSLAKLGIPSRVHLARLLV